MSTNHLYTDDLTGARWRKSSYSDAGQQCIEITDLPGGLALRDSKDTTLTPLRITTAQWNAFCGGVIAGDLLK